MCARMSDDYASRILGSATQGERQTDWRQGSSSRFIAGTLAARKPSVIRPSLLRSFASSAASASSVDVSAALVNSKLR